MKEKFFKFINGDWKEADFPCDGVKWEAQQTQYNHETIPVLDSSKGKSILIKQYGFEESKSCSFKSLVEGILICEGPRNYIFWKKEEEFDHQPEAS